MCRKGPTLVFSVLCPIILLVLLLALPAVSSAAPQIKVGGYVKLDVIYETGATDSAAPNPRDTPLDGTADSNRQEFLFDARESRLNFNITDEVEGVKLRGFVEFDFEGGGGNRSTTNSHVPRLRHAFAQGTFRNGVSLLAGQTWSTFTNPAFFANTIDFNGPAGQVFSRQPQIRLGYPLSPNLTLDVAAEQPSFQDRDVPTDPTKFDPSKFNSNTKQVLPQFVGRLAWAGPQFSAEVAATAGQNKFKFASGVTEDEVNWGVQGSVKVPLGPLTLQGHVHYLDGINRYANGDFPDAVLVTTAGAEEVVNLTSLGFFAGGSYQLAQRTMLNAFYAWEQVDDEAAKGFGPADPATRPIADNETLQSIHVNVMHDIVQNWRVGLEWQYNSRELFDGTDGDINKIPRSSPVLVGSIKKRSAADRGRQAPLEYSGRMACFSGEKGRPAWGELWRVPGRGRKGGAGSSRR